MGSCTSKFYHQILNGDEKAALKLLRGKNQLKYSINANILFNKHNNLLHLASYFAMFPFMRTLLIEYNGDPGIEDRHGKNSLHYLFALHEKLGHRMAERNVGDRMNCLTLLLGWKGSLGETINVNAVDQKGNTPLYYAAQFGDLNMVKFLIDAGANIEMKNFDDFTACDVAESLGQHQVALYLESKMLFSKKDEDDNLVETGMYEESDNYYKGLRLQDLQETKDFLLVETSDMLRVSLFAAQVLLHHHEWSREMLLEAWITDPVSCCNKCGITPPTELANHRKDDALENGFSLSTGDSSDPTTSNNGDMVSSDSLATSSSGRDVSCGICFQHVTSSFKMTCDHTFCAACWSTYLTGKIMEGQVNITCAGYYCQVLVPGEVVEEMVPREVARKFMQFDIKAFVESNPLIKWCPHPECGRAVKLPEGYIGKHPSPSTGISPSLETSHAVDCGNGHSFCWECLGPCHEPASCKSWKKWCQEVAQIKPHILSDVVEESWDAANKLWLVSNSKECPQCCSPIQKNEGCNHIKCLKCKHDFCWVCLQPWKQHNSNTGGFFKCNKFDVLKKLEEKMGEDLEKAVTRNERMQSLRRFLEYYGNFTHHLSAHMKEEHLYGTSKQKMQQLSTINSLEVKFETKFIEEAITQLLKARQVLKCSYVFGFYLQEGVYHKSIFETMQKELEDHTEMLSQMISRPYLRTHRSNIVQTTSLVQRRRQELLSAVRKGLLPPEDFPANHHGRVSRDAWVKDSTGRHVLQWTQESDESDADPDALFRVFVNTTANESPLNTTFIEDLSQDFDISAPTDISQHRHIRSNSISKGLGGSRDSIEIIRHSLQHKDVDDGGVRDTTDVALFYKPQRDSNILNTFQAVVNKTSQFDHKDLRCCKLQCASSGNLFLPSTIRSTFFSGFLQNTHQTDSQPRHQTDSQPRHQTDPQPRHQSDKQTRHQSEPKTRHQPSPQTRHQTDTQTRHQTDPQPRHQIDTQPRHQTDTPPRHQTDPQPRHQTDTQTRQKCAFTRYETVVNVSPHWRLEGLKCLLVPQSLMGNDVMEEGLKRWKSEKNLASHNKTKDLDKTKKFIHQLKNNKKHQINQMNNEMQHKTKQLPSQPQQKLVQMTHSPQQKVKQLPKNPQHNVIQLTNKPQHNVVQLTNKPQHNVVQLTNKPQHNVEPTPRNQQHHTECKALHIPEQHNTHLILKKHNKYHIPKQHNKYHITQQHNTNHISKLDNTHTSSSSLLPCGHSRNLHCNTNSNYNNNNRKNKKRHKGQRRKPDMKLNSNTGMCQQEAKIINKDEAKIINKNEKKIIDKEEDNGIEKKKEVEKGMVMKLILAKRQKLLEEKCSRLEHLGINQKDHSNRHQLTHIPRHQLTHTSRHQVTHTSRRQVTHTTRHKSRHKKSRVFLNKSVDGRTGGWRVEEGKEKS